jgi:hypothetical protein
MRSRVETKARRLRPILRYIFAGRSWRRMTRRTIQQRNGSDGRAGQRPSHEEERAIKKGASFNYEISATPRSHSHHVYVYLQRMRSRPVTHSLSPCRQHRRWAHAPKGQPAIRQSTPHVARASCALPTFHRCCGPPTCSSSTCSVASGTRLRWASPTKHTQAGRRTSPPTCTCTCTCTCACTCVYTSPHSAPRRGALPTGRPSVHAHHGSPPTRRVPPCSQRRIHVRVRALQPRTIGGRIGVHTRHRLLHAVRRWLAVAARARG